MVSTIEENIGIDSSGMNDMLFRFTEPEEKRRAKEIFVRFHIGAVIILVVSSDLSYINGMMNSMIIFASGAAFIGGHALWSMHKDSFIGNIGLTAKGIILDIVALYKELSGLKDVITISGRGANLVRFWYPFLYPVTVAVNAIGIATAATDLVGDTGRLTQKLQEG